MPVLASVHRARIALVKLHAHAFARGPLAALVAIGIACSVVFSKNGLDPRDAARLLAPGSLARAIVLVAWIAVARASSRLLLLPPGATYLRASALSRTFQRAVAAVFVLAAQAPLPLVFVAGRAPLEGATLALALATACIAPVSGVAPRRNRASRSGLVSMALAVAFGVFSFAPGLVVLFPLVLVRAHRDAPILPRSRAVVRLPLHWPLQLVVTQLRALVRHGSARLVLAASSPALGLLLVRAADPEDRAERARSLAAVVATLAAAPIVFRVGSTLRALRPVFRASSRPIKAPLVVAVAIVATPSFAFAAGTHAIAHESALPAALASICVLVVVEGWLAAKRRDAATAWTLLSIPLATVFTLLSRAKWNVVCFAIGALALAAAEPEVSRADDR